MIESNGSQLVCSPSIAAGMSVIAPVLASQPVATASIELEIALAVVLFIGFVVALWWVWQFYERGTQIDNQGAHKQGQLAATSDGQSVDPPRQPTLEGGLLRSPASDDDEMAPEKLFFSSDGELPARRCPQCDRTFPGVFEICPFDTSRLREITSTSSDKQPGRHLPRRFCSRCERRYELTARYCYDDGQKLDRDHERAGEDAVSFRICRNCGWESCEDIEQGCGCDEPSLTVLDPTRRRHITPAFPFNRCRQCGHLASPEETTCPVDGTLLLPELSARLTVLPPTGHGKRRRICPDCGVQFAPQCNFCSYDGTSLVDIN